MAKQTTNQDQLKAQNEAAREFLDLLSQQKAAMNELKKSLKGNLDEQSLITDETKEAVSLARTLAGYTIDQLSSKKEEARFTEKLSKVLQQEVLMEQKVASLLRSKSKESRKHAEQLNDQLSVSRKATIEAKATLELYKKVNKETAFFDKMSGLVNEIPVLRKLFPEMEKAAVAAREAAAKNESAWKAASKVLAEAASKAVTAFSIGILIKGLTQVDTQIQNIGRSLNLGNEASRQLFRNLTKSGDYTSEQLIKGVVGLNTELGTAAGTSLEVAETMATLTERMGVGASTVNKLFTASASAGKNFKEYTASIIGGVKVLNLANKSAIDYKAVMGDIASAGAATRLSLSNFPGGITKAAFEARKLGLSLMQLESIGAGLLDFESSISGELEAELLTGKELNLEKARMFALTNDMVGLNNELAKQGITQEKFGRMNRLAQESTAKAMGMTRDQMAEMFEKQKAQAEMAKYVQKLKDSELGTAQKIQTLIESGMSKSEAIAKLGMDELEYRKEEATVQERQAILMDKLLTLGEKFFKVLEPIKGVLKFAADHADSIYKVLMLIAGLRFTGMIGNLLKGLKTARSAATNLSSTAAATSAGTASASTSGAASNLVRSASSPTGYRNAAGQFAAAPAANVSGGGGMFSNIIGKGKDMLGKAGSALGKMNPLKGATQWMSKNAGKLLKFPIISSIIEGIFAKSDIEDMIASASSKEDLYKSVGKRTFQGIGAIGGAALGASLGSFIPIPGIGTILGGMGGDIVGRMVGSALADGIGADGTGKFVIDNLFPSAKTVRPELALAKGGIVTSATTALVGEAGPEAVVPLNQFYAKMDELIKVIKEGGDVYMDGNKVGHTLALSSYKSS